METNSTHSKITKEEFFELIKMHDDQSKRLDKLSEAGLPVWEMDIIEYGNLLFDKVINSYFTQEGEEWIFWWLYEKSGNPEIKVWDENHNEIPTETIEDLWKCVKQYRK